jgi:hypothetical protein
MGISQLITSIDLFKRKFTANSWDWDTGFFVGRPFRMSYSTAEILVSDAWKQRSGGIPQGAFLLAYYDSEVNNKKTLEAILLRVIEPTSLPQDQDVVTSMIEYYQEDIKTGTGDNSQLDSHTRYRYSFSGIKCSVLGCFYIDSEGKTRFGADLENFYSAHNYSVIKPTDEILKYIVNYRESSVPGGPNDIRIGKVRYSSSQRFQSGEYLVPVFVHAQDFAGKRTALFGMTRTGKSNTTKKIIQACVEMSEKADLLLDKSVENAFEVLKPFKESGEPKYPIGQIIFDINGEYANPNLQDQGTAIFDLYKDKTIRYSNVPKEGFREMKVNFYKEIDEGFSLIKSFPPIADDSSRFVTNFKSVSLEAPEDYFSSEGTRHQRRLAVYFCCLKAAGFSPPKGFTVKFRVSEEILKAVDPSLSASDSRGTLQLSLDEAVTWWDKLWAIYGKSEVFTKYKEDNGKEWADDDLKALLTILTRKRNPSSSQADCSGFRILKGVIPQHTSVDQKPFDQDVLEQLRAGRIVIIDLSLGDEDIQRMFSERITKKIFRDALSRFTSTKPNNFIQFYFEEAHNLFPKKEDKDLSQIYNRLAKEGAKLNLGLVYATQEVSSISNNILKATQNWFISHLNNHDEIRELNKYYDFSDFSDALIKFSQDTDKGFARVKTYSSAFVVPVQIDRFPPEGL